MTEYRASFDAEIEFGNGGDLAVHGFRVDVPGPEVSEPEIGALFVASLGLLMTNAVRLSNVEVFAEPHKGTRGGPSGTAAEPPAGGRFVELNHVVRDPTTGTYLDPPSHRYADGVPLENTVDLPAVVVRVTGSAQRGIDVGAVAAVEVRGAAVLLHTGDAAGFGTPAYAENGHFLTRAGAEWLATNQAALVGIDAADLDDTADGERPAHSVLLRAGVPVVEHLTDLDQLPPTGARFTAVPLRIEGMGAVPVRAFARLPEDV